MKAHVRIHGYLPLLFALLLAALPGMIVAYGLYPNIMQKCINNVLHEVHVLFMGSSSISSEESEGGYTRGRSSSTSRPRSSSQSRHTSPSPSPSPPKKHVSVVEENHGSTSASASASASSSSSRRKSTAATATSTVKESKTPKPDRHSILPSASTTGVKNDRKSISKSNGKSAKEEEEEEERLRIAAEMDVYKGTRSKTPMKRK